MKNTGYQSVRKLTQVLILFWLVLLVGCKSMLPLDHSDSEVIAKIEVGDQLQMFEKSGRVTMLKVAFLDETRVRGMEVTSDGELLPSGGEVEVQWENVTKLEIWKIDGGKTTLAVLGGIVLAPFALAGAIVVLMASG